MSFWCLQFINPSGCPTKDHFNVKNAFLLFLEVKWPFVGQTYNFINCMYVVDTEWTKSPPLVLIHSGGSELVASLYIMYV
jgi:hypothetical protein